MNSKVKAWLEDGTIDIFLGYKEIDHHPLPYCFTKERLDEVEDLVLSPVRYSLEKIATHMAAVEPGIKIGMLARDCNSRALNVLYLWNQLNPDNVRTVNVNCCPSRLKEHGDCSYLEPETIGAYKKQVGVDNNLALEDVEAYGETERLDRWMYEFQKCIKCYGCRNICPVCFCKECSLEHDELVRTGPLFAGCACLSYGKGSAYGRPLHRLWVMRGCLPNGYPAAIALPEGQSNCYGSVRL